MSGAITALAGVLPAAVSLVFGLPSTGGAMIGTLQLDVIMNERITLESAVTQYPVESGSPKSDGILLQSAKLSMHGFVMNGGVTVLGGLLDGSGGMLGMSKLLNAISVLRALALAQTPITIVTEMGVYQNYGMARCDIDRAGEGKGGELQIDAEFIQITVATVRTATVSIANANPASTVAGKAGATRASAGPAATAAPDTTTATKGQSIASRLLGIGG